MQAVRPVCPPEAGTVISGGFPQSSAKELSPESADFEFGFSFDSD